MESRDFYRVTPCDVVIIVLILLFSTGAILHTRRGLSRQSPEGLEAVLYHEGTLFERLRLDNDREISVLNGRMSIEIKQGRIRVSKSDCPRQICVNMGWIKTPGQVIACVPNKFLVEIKSAGSPVLDAVVY
jgi:hypothetical protein